MSYLIFPRGFTNIRISHDCTNEHTESCFAPEPEHELFLVYGKGRPGVIRGMDMNAKVPDEYMIPIENLMNPRALDFHAESEFIYFADATSYIIGRQKIDGTERDTILKEGTGTNMFWASDSRLNAENVELKHKVTGNEKYNFQPQFQLQETDFLLVYRKSIS